MLKRTISFLLIGLFPVFLSAQVPKRYHSGDIRLMLHKLDVLGNVLYLAAHPDDENTRMITYMANVKKVNTAYFSFTRGDGGQNLIGPEIRELLGLIRTHELLEARKIDNGIQYFSRTNDFGFSKHPDETFTIWNKEKALADLVWIIRNYKPDVIINRFNTIPGETHGHHTASAILAEEAFEMAGNPEKFPDQLRYTDIWQPSALYWNTYYWMRSGAQRDTSELVKYNIGAYIPQWGKSVSEIAAESRSMHKSQGFGATGVRGINYDFLQQLWGEKTHKDIFEHIDISWNRVAGSELAAQLSQKANRDFDPDKPATIVPTLIELKKAIQLLEDPYWRKVKEKEVDELIYACLGLFLELRVNDRSACPGEVVSLTAEMINRSDVNVSVKSIMLEQEQKHHKISRDLKNNISQDWKYDFTIDQNADHSQPYWLREEGSIGMFIVNDQSKIGKPVNEPAISGIFVLDVNGVEVSYTKEAVFKRNDPVKGEVYSPFYITPEVFVNLSDKVVIFPEAKSKNIAIRVKAGKDKVNGVVSLDLPKGWQSKPHQHNFQLRYKGEDELFTFEVSPPSEASDIEVSAIAKINENFYKESLLTIEYDHIPYQMLFPLSKIRLTRLDLQKRGNMVGYVMGAGDDVPAALRQLGYKVEIINDIEFDADHLDSYDAIILGVRALNTVERLRFDMSKLLAYTERGGTLIVQYNTNSRLVTQEFSPYQLEISRDRITVEDAPVKMINQNHPLLNFPNKITNSDFEDWVQERGLYFPNRWGDEFSTVIASSDPGEDALKGGLLAARYGKGYYIYTGYAWFRQLPAGVPGAFRLFTNMISIGKTEQQ
ncbi:MAG: PIG-L family deacetylase [Cyclobacteriaceae bacterium]|nr:PIG-L family deacetylase [Cyclobacteriaceae bacterium]